MRKRRVHIPGDRIGLRGQLLFLILLAVLPGTVAVLTMAVSEYHTRRSDLLNSAVHMAGELAHAEGEVLTRATHTTKILAMTLGEAGPRERCGAVTSFLQHHNGYLNAGYISGNGDLKCSALLVAPGITYLGDRHYFVKAIASGGPAIGNYQIGRVTRDPSLNIGYAVHDQDTVIGVAYVAIGLHRLSQLARNLALSGAEFMALVSPRGKVLARYPDPNRYVGSGLPVHRIRAARSVDDIPGVSELADAHHHFWLYAHVPVHIAGIAQPLTAIVGLPVSRTYAPIERRLELSAAGGLAVGLVVFGLVWLRGEHTVVKPLRELSLAVVAFGRGNLDHRLGWKRRDEIGRLGEAFDRMVDDVAVHRRQTERVNYALRTLSASNRALTRASREEPFLRTMCEIPVEYGRYVAAWIGFAKKDGSVQIKAYRSTDQWLDDHASEVVLRWDETPEGGGSVGRAIRSGRPVVIRDFSSRPESDPWRVLLTRARIRSAASLPLRIQDKVAGMLLIHSEHAEAFGDEEIEVLGDLATDIGYGLTQMRLHRRHLEVRRRMRRLSATDPVTGLASRQRFLQRFAQWERRRGRSGGRLAVAVLQVCRFDSINLAFGRATGDRVLREMGKRLQQTVAPLILAGRWGGCEIVLMSKIGPEHGPEDLAAAIQALADRPLRAGEIEIQLDTSLGLALYPDHGTDIETLLIRARVAANQAFAEAVPHRVHKGDPEREASQRLEVLAALMSAIDEHQLELHYQPKLDLRNGRACGVEALLRWQHPEWGNVPPDEFMPLTEQTRLIQPVTAFGLRQAWTDHRILTSRGYRLPVALNLSARVLHQQDLIDEIAKLVAGHDAPQPWLELELTETAVMEDRLRTLLMLELLTDLGVPIHLDDFGTGYSSLAYLQQLPVTTVKVDKSFVGDMATNERNSALVRATIDVAHTLGLEVVAEGVESAEAMTMLHRMGCDKAQGYFIGRPMPLPALLEWMDDDKASKIWWSTLSGIRRQPD